MVTSQLIETPLKAAQLKTEVHPDWCAGCGDFGIINALQQVLAEMRLPPWETMFFSGVGCSGKSSHYVNVYGVHTLHGRVLGFAQGAKIANPKMNVVAAGGDGDGYGIGAGHFVHAGRRNIDMTYMVYNNEVYGLTKGQASPTLERGAKPKSLPLPNINQSINPLALAVACGYTFVARSYAYNAKHLKATIKAAIEHKGMALVDILQPCPTYNDLHTKEFYAEEVEVAGNTVPRVYLLEETGYDGVVKNPHDLDEINEKRMGAIQRAYQKEEQVPIGIYYQVALATYEELLKTNLPALNEYTPNELPYYDKATMKPTTDLTSAMAQYVL